jgi:cyclic pyranopterin phosphate synthase
VVEKLTISTVLSHFDAQSNKARMVDVSGKQLTERFAHARAWIRLPSECTKALTECNTKKGSPLHVAVLGGIMATKQTSMLIPLCHQVPLTNVDVQVEQVDNLVKVDCMVKAFYHTGVEMEALVGASVASLIVYDMLKAASHGMVIESVELIKKSGGKRDVGC